MNTKPRMLLDKASLYFIIKELLNSNNCGKEEVGTWQQEQRKKTPQTDYDLKASKWLQPDAFYTRNNSVEQICKNMPLL